MYTSKDALSGSPPPVPVPGAAGAYYDAAVAAGTETQVPVLLEYWYVVRRWRWVIAGIILAALIIGAVLTMLMTPMYTATARLEIARAERNVSPIEGVERAEAYSSPEFYQTQYNLLRARSLAERVARELRLSRDDKFRAAVGLPAEPTEGLLGANRDAAVIGALLSNIDVNPVQNSSLVDVSFTSADPTVSAEIANAWVEQFVEASIARRFDATADARQFLETRLNDLRGRLETSERELINYAEDAGIVTIDTTEVDGKTTNRRTLASADLAALNEELASATAERIAAQARAANASASDTQDLIANITAPMRQRRVELSSEYERMMVQFEPNYPPARALKEQIDALDRSIAREEARVRSSQTSALQDQYRAALSREQQLRSRVAQLRAQFNSQQRAGIENNIIQREVDTNRELYNSLLQRYKEIGVAGVGANNIAVVDDAEVPGSPSQPNLMFNLALALLAGIIVAGATTLALNQIDEGIRTPAEMPVKLGIPLLGSVPDQDRADILAEIEDVKSELSEAYLSIMSSLSFSTSHGLPRSLMLTSTRAAEGKSTSSLALATMIGRSDRKVLLIDADMRKASLHEFLGLSNNAGLSNYLAGEENLGNLLQRSRVKGMSLLAAGPKPPSAAELLSGDRFSHLLAELSREFEHIVIDGPPILGLADAPLLSRQVEGCIFVVEARGVPVRGARHSLARLQSANANIVGAILTKLERTDATYGYGYGFGYGYGHHEDASQELEGQSRAAS